MSKFWVFSGVKSKVASHLDDVELYTRDIPFNKPPLILTSSDPFNEVLLPEKDGITLSAF